MEEEITGEEYDSNIIKKDISSKKW